MAATNLVKQYLFNLRTYATWQKMKKLLLACILFSILLGMTPETLPPNGWISLFNGKDLKNWDIKIAGHALNENYGNTFRVENGVIKVAYNQYSAFDDKFGHIFYKQKYSYYLLSLEYRFTGNQVAGGPDWAVRNSGVMLHAQSAASMNKNQDFPICIEAQFLGGNGKDKRSTLNLCTPGTHVVLNGKLFTIHCIDSESKTYHGDQWVKAELLVLGDSLIKHIVEGETVLAYEKPQIGGGHVDNYDPKVKVDGRVLKDGYIALQSESHPVEFRKVELFNLEPYARNPKKLRQVLGQLQKRKQ
jgi:hypothetical protein